jgi:predicted lysophospholipase L1 biosynthesis ABC-type transport system permease subunit
LTLVVGVIAIAVGIVLGVLMPWRRIRPAPAPVETPPDH